MVDLAARTEVAVKISPAISMTARSGMFLVKERLRNDGMKQSIRNSFRFPGRVRGPYSNPGRGTRFISMLA
jgi:hypothetical protein